MFEELLATIESELKSRKFRIEMLKEENDKLTAENADLKLKLAEKEKYIADKEW